MLTNVKNQSNLKIPNKIKAELFSALRVGSCYFWKCWDALGP